MSDFIPNSFQTPNAVVDHVMQSVSGGELKVIIYILRHTSGSCGVLISLGYYSTG